MTIANPPAIINPDPIWVLPGCPRAGGPVCGHELNDLCHCGQRHRKRLHDACHGAACHAAHVPGLNFNAECAVCGAHWVCLTDARQCSHHPQYGGPRAKIPTP